MMLIGTWIFGFTPLLWTWNGVWGKFGWDQEIGIYSAGPSRSAITDT